jgi:ribonuclease HI
VIVLDGIVCDAGISKYGIGGKRVRIRVFDLDKKNELLKKEYEKSEDINIAELKALYEAVKIAHFRQQIFSDSLTAINWINDESFDFSKETKNKLLNKIRKNIFLKELKLKFWDKKSLGENPADCKKSRPARRLRRYRNKLLSHDL